MKERPILFSGPMVRAILDGRKTQTRRVCKKTIIGGYPPPASVHRDGSGTGWIAWWPNAVSAEETRRRYPGEDGFKCPYGKPGDRLWVRETHRAISVGGAMKDTVLYRATPDLCMFLTSDGEWRQHNQGKHGFGIADIVDDTNWTPSIHMPRWASRITLEITGVRVERLREISEEDAIAEGIVGDESVFDQATPRMCFADLWDSINAKTYPWDSDPWVWVIEFKRV